MTLTTRPVSKTIARDAHSTMYELSTEAKFRFELRIRVRALCESDRACVRTAEAPRACALTEPPDGHRRH